MPDALGARIRVLRESKGWSQGHLAALMQLRGHPSITQKRQSEIELGRRKVGVDEAVSYARIFGIRITDLLGVPDSDRP